MFKWKNGAVILAVVLIAKVLTGCTFSDAEKAKLEKAPFLAEATLSTGKTRGDDMLDQNNIWADNTKDPTMYDVNRENREIASNQIDIVTYFSLKKEKIYPVSWISGGVQQLSGDMGPYSLWQDSILSGAPAPENLPQVHIDGQNRGELQLYSNGNWDFFPDSVQVQSYEPGDVTWDSPWYTYFYEKLGNYGSYSPVIIQEAVTFTWNGRRAELVTAINLIEANLENTEDSGEAYRDTPGNKGPSVYTFVTLFLDGRTACDLYDYCYMIPSEQSEDDSEILYEAKEGYIPYMTTWQYDMEGNVIEVPLYVNDTGLHSLLPHTSRLSSLVSDLDGDGDSEILICTEAYSSLYSNYQVYDMNNGEVSVSFSVGMN